MSTNQPTTASRLYTQVKKLEDDIATELTNQSTAKANLDRLDRERQTHQAVVNDKHKTSDEIEQAKTELKRIEDERKAADKQFRDSTTTLTDLYKEKDQAGDELTTVLETPVVNTTNEALVIELNELKSAFALMTLDQNSGSEDGSRSPAGAGSIDESRQERRGTSHCNTTYHNS